MFLNKNVSDIDQATARVTPAIPTRQANRRVAGVAMVASPARVPRQA
jgi:hypothetical protein